MAAYDEAEPVFTTHNEPTEAARCQENRANTLEHLGRYQEALAGYDQAESMYATHGLMVGVASCRLNRAATLKNMGRFDEAIRGYDVAEALFHKLDMKTDVALCQVGQAMALHAQGHYQRALSLYSHGLGQGRGSGRRGAEPFVPIDWDRALDLVAKELTRVRDVYGHNSIYGGSYGWGSAGAFHFPPVQLQHFLGQFGGFVRSVNTYSTAAGDVIMPYVAGNFFRLLVEQAPWPTIAKHSKLVVTFGGIALKNTQIAYGGVARHRTHDGLRACQQAGVEFVYLGPLRNDAADFLGAEWLTPRPNTDVAFMRSIRRFLQPSRAPISRGFAEKSSWIGGEAVSGRKIAQPVENAHFS